MHLREVPKRLAKLALIDQHGGDVVAVQGVLRGQLNGDRYACHRFVEPALPGVKQAEVVMERRLLGIGFDGPLILPTCLVGLSKLLFQSSVAQQRGQVVGLELQRRLILLLGVGRIA